MISSNAVFQSLVETAVFLNTEDVTPIDGETFDRQLGRFNALQGMKARISRDEMFAQANTIHVYCGFEALKAYCHELSDEGFSTPYWFTEDRLHRVDRDHEGMRFLAVMDVFEIAVNGENLGWKRQWCPFRGPAETLWHTGFRGEKSDIQVRATEVLLGERIARFHSVGVPNFGERAG